ncbi:MAG: L-threonylcarbamoyladenylate synthase [Kofleriaceae bacterium]
MSAASKEPPRGDDVERAAAVLRAGGLVAFPTETVYGLGADAANAAALARLYAVKGRPRSHPLIVHLGDARELDAWGTDLSSTARTLAARFWPGPLTLIVCRSARVSPVATAELSTVGLRVPDHPLARAFLRAFGGGVAAPSANRYGRISPTSAAHVVAELGDAVDYVLEAGRPRVGVESTIVDVSRGGAALLRAGGVTREALEAVVGPLQRADAHAPAAPGTTPSHYAPRARLVAVSAEELPAAVAALADAGVRVAALASSAVLGRSPDLRAATYPLPNDAEGMARELYAAMREVDGAGFDVIVAALPAEVGLGEAIADRLRRAAGPRAGDDPEHDNE